MQIGTGSTSIRAHRQGNEALLPHLPARRRAGPRGPEHAGEVRLQKVAILHDNSAYAKGLADEAKQRILDKKSADIVFFDALVPGERDYSAILTKIKGVKPDAILFTGYYPEAGLLLRQMQEMKWAVPIIGGDATNNTDLVKIAGDAAAGYRFISPIMPADIDTPMAKAFLKAYEAKYHSLPSSIWSVLAGDAYNVLIAAIKAKGPDPAAIAGYLHNDLKNLDCFTGQISFDEKGDRVGDLYRLYEVNAKGEFILQPK